ncbi:hypothetical protein RCZAHN_76 [Rhodobacter phage RcZahn]|nr:hypothetical protein RCZAHN_76 [Rhodobacter phage RcZahn]
MTKATGYAHVGKDGMIHVKTVAHTRIAAAVNALFCIYGLAVMHGTPDPEIEAAYTKVSAQDGASIREVTIAINCNGEAA